MKSKVFILIPLLFTFCFCSKAEQEILVDFIEEFDQATTVRPYQTVNLFRSWNADERPYGWTKNRLEEKNAILVPTHRERAVYRFGCLTKKRERISIQLRSMLGAEVPSLDIFLNGNRLFASTLDWLDYRRISFVVPKDYFRIGQNFLEFKRSSLPSGLATKHWLAVRKIVFGAQTEPADSGDDDEKRADTVVKKSLFTKKRGLALSPNSAVNYVAKLTQPAMLDFELGWENKEPSGLDGRRFFIMAETATGESRMLYNHNLAEDSASKLKSLPLDLSPFQNAIVQISFVFLNETADVDVEERLVVWEPRVFPAEDSPIPVKQDVPGLQNPFNVLIYLVDALRPDHLPFFGYEKNTAPRMAEFAEDCVLFKNAYAQSAWTRPSVGALFTGLYPFQHQAITLKSGLAAELETLAEILGGSGFYTIGISSNAGIKEFFNFHQGFAYFKYHSNLDGGQADVLNTYAFEQFGLKREPFFLYLHTMEPHRPYLLREEFIPPPVKEVHRVSVGDPGAPRYTVNLPQVLSHYDAAISQNDKAFGDLMDEMKRQGLYDDTLIILMSDHGEEFYEHEGFAHGNKLYQESIKHLFIVKLPQQENAGTLIEENVQEIDIFPTILDLAGLPVPSYCAGKSLRQILLDPDAVVSPFHREIFVESGDELRKKAVIDGRWKLIHTGKVWREDLHDYELFDLEQDPEERLNLYGHNPVVAQYLKRRLNGWALAQKKLFALGKEDIEKTLTEKEIEELKALGYIE
jgi:arylsulfatase A-like enzyme